MKNKNTEYIYKKLDSFYEYLEYHTTDSFLIEGDTLYSIKKEKQVFTRDSLPKFHNKTEVLHFLNQVIDCKIIKDKDLTYKGKTFTYQQTRRVDYNDLHKQLKGLSFEQLLWFFNKTNAKYTIYNWQIRKKVELSKKEFTIIKKFLTYEENTIVLWLVLLKWLNFPKWFKSYYQNSFKTIAPVDYKEEKQRINNYKKKKVEQKEMSDLEV